jgi:hypothetical protein
MVWSGGGMAGKVRCVAHFLTENREKKKKRRGRRWRRKGGRKVRVSWAQPRWGLKEEGVWRSGGGAVVVEKGRTRAHVSLVQEKTTREEERSEGVWAGVDLGQERRWAAGKREEERDQRGRWAREQERGPERLGV